MLQPKRTKFRKQQKGRNRGLAHRGSTVAFGEYGLKATSRGRMTARQIEAGRRALSEVAVRPTPEVVATLQAQGLGGLSRPVQAEEILRRPRSTWNSLRQVAPLPELSAEASEQVEIDVK